MKRAKPKKKKEIQRPTRTPFEIVKTTNYFNLAVIVRVLWTVYGWRHKRIAYFLESYISLIQEVADNRSGVNEFIKDTKKMTGVDVVRLLDEIYK